MNLRTGRVSFGGFELDFATGELRYQGARVKLQAQPCQVLELLLERPGEVVTREELRSRLWSADTFVDFEHGLNTAVKKLRHALGDSAESPRYVETLAKRGYRFVAPVKAADATAGSQPLPTVSRPRSTSPWVFALTLTAVALALLTLYWTTSRVRTPATRLSVSVAVFPFHVLDDGGLEPELGVGLADSVISHLAEVRGLRVKPMSSVLAREERLSSAREAGAALDVDSVLTGTVRRGKEGFRVAALLLPVSEGAAVRRQVTFDLEESELAHLADRIAEFVVHNLGLALANAPHAGGERRHPKNAAAYEAYLVGRARLVRYTREGMLAAVQSFEKALRLDPDYAPAYAGLALAAAEIHLRFAPEAEVEAWGERAKEAAARAQALDPDLSETHQALAAVYGKTEFEWDRTIEESRRALELNPGLELPYAYLARAYYHLGLLQSAEDQARVALALDPDNRTEPLRAKAIAALLAGRAAEAVPDLEDVQRISGRPHSDSWLAQALYYSGDSARAETQLDAVIGSSSAAASTRGRATLAGILAARGERARAEELVRLVIHGKYMDHHVAYSLGAALAQLGRRDEAIEWLQRAARTGFPCYAWYARDPLLRPLRTQPEFTQLLDELARSRDAAQARYLSESRIAGVHERLLFAP